MATQPSHHDSDLLEKAHASHLESFVKEEQTYMAEAEKYGHKKTDPAEIKLVKKLDFYIMPTLWVMYWFNYLDRNAIAVARLDNMEDDLGLTGTQYLTSISILFVGYLLGQVPSNMLITRVRPSWYMAGFMALWAIVSTLTAVCQDFKGLLLCRFFLGVTEAPFYPGALYILSIFYSRREIATRISILFTGNILATAAAGLIALGVFQMSGAAGIAGWRWLFIIQGVVTFVLAIAAAFILPDEPLTTRWLSEEERKLAHTRIHGDTVGVKERTSSWTGLKEACSDYRLWIFVAMQFFHLAASGFKNFMPSVVGTLGFSRTITLVLICPPYLIGGFFSIFYAANSGRMNERTWHITAAKLVAIFGFVLACATLNTGARYFAMIAFIIGVYACNSIILGWVSSTCGQTNEKKATSLAIVNSIASTSAIWGPYLWPEWDEPRYTIAMTSSAAFSGLAAALAWWMKWLLVRENRRIKQSNDEGMLLYAY